MLKYLNWHHTSLKSKIIFLSYGKFAKKRIKLIKGAYLMDKYNVFVFLSEMKTVPNIEESSMLTLRSV